MNKIVACMATAFFINIVLIIASFLESNSASQFLRLAVILNSAGLVLSVTWLFMLKKR